jgi:hypothetical protein
VFENNVQRIMSRKRARHTSHVWETRNISRIEVEVHHSKISLGDYQVPSWRIILK